MMFSFLSRVIFVVGILITGRAFAQSCDSEILKILAPDGSSNDNYGASVDIDGATVLVGSEFEDEVQLNAGAAYLFDLGSGEMLAKLHPVDKMPHGYFGSAVALDGGVAVVGSYNDSAGGYHNGAVYFFDAADGELMHDIASPTTESYQYFGWSVAVDGATALVGAPRDGRNGNDAGVVYVVDVDAGAFVHRLQPRDPEWEGRFGYSVGLSGTIAIVGSCHFNQWGSRFSGSARLFDTRTGEQLVRLHTEGVEKSDRFGSSVAIDGAVAVVGAPWDDDQGIDAGAAYVFDVKTGELMFKLVADDGGGYDEFGASVSIDGATILVGAPKDGDRGLNSGAMYVFDAVSGEQIQKIGSSDGEYGDRFGTSVAIDGTHAFAGAFKDDDHGPNAGAAYLFDIRNEPCIADISQDCTLNFEDVSEFLFAFGLRDDAVDFSGDGSFNFSDVSLFLSSFGDGCP